MAGPIERLILGLNKKYMIPCGFCFVIYFCRKDAQRAIDLLNKTLLDGNVIRVDFDIGFSEGRQYGRGYLGGQVRDEVKRKPDFKPESGFGGNKRNDMKKHRSRRNNSREGRRWEERKYRDSKRNYSRRKFKRVK